MEIAVSIPMTATRLLYARLCHLVLTALQVKGAFSATKLLPKRCRPVCFFFMADATGSTVPSPTSRLRPRRCPVMILRCLDTVKKVEHVHSNIYVNVPRTRVTALASNPIAVYHMVIHT